MDESLNPLNGMINRPSHGLRSSKPDSFDQMIDCLPNRRTPRATKKLWMQKVHEPGVLRSTNLIFFKISDYIDFNDTSKERYLWIFKGLDSFCDVFVALIILISQIVILFNVYHESRQKCDDEHPSKILWMGAVLCSLYAGCVSTEAFLLALPYEIYGTDPMKAKELVMRVNESIDIALRQARNSFGPGVAPNLAPDSSDARHVLLRSQSAWMERDVRESSLSTILEVRSRDDIDGQSNTLTNADSVVKQESASQRYIHSTRTLDGTNGGQARTNPAVETEEGVMEESPVQHRIDELLHNALEYLTENSDWLTHLLEDAETDGAMTRAVSKAYLYAVAATLQMGNILLLLVVATVMGNASSFTDLIAKFISVEIVIHVHEIVPRVLKITDKSPSMYNMSGISLEQELEIKGILKSGCVVAPTPGGVGGVYRQSSKSKKNFIFWVFFVLVYFCFLVTTFACHDKKYVGL